MAFTSLFKVEVFLQRKIQGIIVKKVVIGCLFVGSFGVYLGRFLRWNSWDIITNPVNLLTEVIAPFILWLYPQKTDYVKYIINILGWYVLAKISEHFDVAIFNVLHFWSGHTIKHLLGGVTLFYALKLTISWEKQFDQQYLDGEIKNK